MLPCGLNAADIVTCMSLPQGTEVRCPMRAVRAINVRDFRLRKIENVMLACVVFSLSTPSNQREPHVSVTVQGVSNWRAYEAHLPTANRRKLLTVHVVHGCMDREDTAPMMPSAFEIRVVSFASQD